MKNLEIARKYVKAGFSVIPIPLKSKIPLIAWKEYQTRFPTDEELVAWFVGNENIAIITGELSGVTVVDVDAKSGGLETIKTLRLPLTWSVRTGGGGWHYYYKYDKRASQTAGIYRGIDIRNDGGYVIAPPSVHATGLRYEWSWKEDEKADFPISLFQQKEIIKKDWTEIIGKGATTGNRNDLATRVFGALFNLVQPSEWESIVYPLGQAWNAKNNPPLPERELRNVFESIGKRAVNNVRTPTLGEVLANNFTPKEIAERIKEKNREVKKFFSWGDGHLDEIFPLLEYHTYTVLFGQFSSGKTTFAMAMARQNAMAGHKVCFLTLEMSREKLLKLYSFKRGGVSKAQYKAGNYDESIFDKYTKELETVDYIGIDEENTKISYTLNDIEEIIKTKKPDLLFIDNFNKLKGSGTNDINIDNETSSRLLFMARTYKVALVVLHHANKPSKEKKKSILKGIGGMRGTNKINDDADIVVEIGRPTEEQLLTNPPNLSLVAVYKDRDWDCRGTHRLMFSEGMYHEENNPNYVDIEAITKSFNDIPL